MKINGVSIKRKGEIIDIAIGMIILWSYFHGLLPLLSNVMSKELAFVLLTFASLGFVPLILICSWDGVFSRWLYRNLDLHWQPSSSQRLEK